MVVKHSIKSNQIKHVDTALSQQFRDYCNHEFNYSLADVSTKMSYNDTEAVRIMENTIRLRDGHDEMSLPSKDTQPHVPDVSICPLL